MNGFVSYVVLLAAGLAGWGIPVIAQQRIAGKVVNSETGEPVAGASVFVNTTTYGTSSTNSGDFELRGIPVGTYEVVVSSIGYHTFVSPIRVTESRSAFLAVKLVPRSTVLDEVTITPFEADGWTKWGRLFLETFIGTSPNASKTELLNPEAVRFRHYRSDGYLEAVAGEPLLIKNQSLGYMIAYVLEDFRIDFRNRVNQYAGYPHFTEMEGGRHRRRGYAKRRMATYETSRMRFMRSLYRGTFSEEGYQVRRMRREPNAEKRRVKALHRTIYKTAWDSVRQANIRVLADPNTFTEDSLAYFRKVLSQDDELVTVFAELLTIDSLLVDSAEGRKKLAFEDYLHIQHTRLMEAPGYLRRINEARKPGPQTSMLLLYNSPHVWIEPNGGYFPPQGLYTGWYWTWCDNIADLLPLDYEPLMPD